ncbi:hypothetical protein BT69DRAFT_1306352, partial [Atractiella rhizophila]
RHTFTLLRKPCGPALISNLIFLHVLHSSRQVGCIATAAALHVRWNIPLKFQPPHLSNPIAQSTSRIDPTSKLPSVAIPRVQKPTGATVMCGGRVGVSKIGGGGGVWVLDLEREDVGNVKEEREQWMAVKMFLEAASRWSMRRLVKFWRKVGKGLEQVPLDIVFPYLPAPA